MPSDARSAVSQVAPTRLGLLMRKDEMGLLNSRADVVRGRPDARFPEDMQHYPWLKEKLVPDEFR